MALFLKYPNFLNRNIGPQFMCICEDFELIGLLPGNFLEQRALPQDDSVLRDPGPVPAGMAFSHGETFILELVVLWVPHKPITFVVAVAGGVAANLRIMMQLSV